MKEIRWIQWEMYAIMSASDEEGSLFTSEERRRL